MERSLPDTRPFAPFEWMLAGRYLRARRREGFISVISLFSFLGILLGVATLIEMAPIGLARAHQGLALALFGLAVAHASATRAEAGG